MSDSLSGLRPGTGVSIPGCSTYDKSPSHHSHHTSHHNTLELEILDPLSPEYLTYQSSLPPARHCLGLDLGKNSI